MRRFLILAAAVLATACGGGGGGKPPDPVVGPAGGTVPMPNGPSITIPANALPTETTITIEQTGTAPSGNPLYTFGPSGTTFNPPATVRMPIPAGAVNPTLYWSRLGSTSLYDVIPATVASGKLEASVTHFSTAFVGAACTQGTACPIATACRAATMVCASGTPVCTDTGANLPDQSACTTGTGASGTCSAGTCIAVAATPTFSPAGGSYGSAQQVTISTTTPSATIYYTTDGTPPTTGSLAYTAPVTVASSLTLQAIATATGYTQSAVGAAVYTIGTPQAALPVITPGSGSYTSAQSVSISDATPGAAIHYTVDGTDPTGSSPLYTAPFIVAGPVTIVKAIATATGYAPSDVAVATFSISAGDFATFCAGYNADLAAFLVSCLKANPALAALGDARLIDNGFFLIPCDVVAQEIQVGRVAYSVTNPTECRSALAARTCTGPPGGGGGPTGLPAACGSIFAGLVPSGGACTHDTGGLDCADGYCARGQFFTCGANICTPFVGAGGACPAGNECGPGLVCDFSASPTCKIPSALGGACPCEPGLQCDSASHTCISLPAAGAPCVFASQCELGLTCAGGAGATTCQPLVGLGGACNVADTLTNCGAGYHCASNVCVADLLPGQACAAGQACIGGTCDPSSLKCVVFTNECAVPAGMTLFDAFTSPSLSNQKWQGGGQSRGVSGGEAFLGLDVADLRPRTLRNDGATTSANVFFTAPNRVTTLQTDLRVPAASASRSGGTVARAFVRNLYSPPAQRALTFPGNQQDLLLAEVGLIEDGTGLKVYRHFFHCDDPLCASQSASGITVVDPAGISAIANHADLAGATAAYDTSYTFAVSLNETTGIFTWTISGGALPAGGLTGTADPAAYLAASPNWSPPGGTAILLAGTGFQAATIGVRAYDNAGGGSARFVGWFDNVRRGVNNGAAVPWDDFSGTAPNSGPADLSPLRWLTPGALTAGPALGSLRVAHHATSVINPANSVVTASSSGHSLVVNDPTGLHALQVDAAFDGFATTGTGSSTVTLVGRLYNDGTGTRAADATGDVQAQLSLSATGPVSWQLFRCTATNCSTVTSIGSGTLGSAGAGSHRLLLRWDTVAKRFIFTVDGNIATVDPATIGPVATGGNISVAVPAVGPARAPTLQVNSTATIGATVAGATTGATVRLNDAYTGP